MSWDQGGDWDVDPEDWDNQSDWGPKYASWWEVCEKCGGFYNWFRIDVMEGVEMMGWLHMAGYCDAEEGARIAREGYGGSRGCDELEVFDTRGKKSG